MDPLKQQQLSITRRRLFSRTAGGLGVAALSSLLDPQLLSAATSGPATRPNSDSTPSALAAPHFPPKVRRVIYLFQSGGPSHIDLFDYKPQLRAHHGKELPASVRMGQRLTEMTHKQKTLPCTSTIFNFRQHGQGGMWLSELLPHIGSIADRICLIKSMFTDAVNHDPAITLLNTGHQQPGKPSMGSWLSYGIGCETQNLPAYVVMLSQGSGLKVSQPLFSRLWGSGFLPSQHQGVRFRSGRDPVLYLSDPPGLDRTSRRRMLDSMARLNAKRSIEQVNPEIESRIVQYEMAFRMQTSVPDLMDLSDETTATLEMYGESAKKPGTYAANCLLARRLAERGVRFIQLFHRGWDQHGGLPGAIRKQCEDTDQASAALVKDLAQRGMLDDTLIIWGGEFGRTVYCQGQLTANDYGRDHHGRCFSLWLAGGGIRAGHSHGETDDFCYNITRDKVEAHDLNATILKLLGIDDKRLTFPYQGLDQRLTGVDEDGRIVKQILA